MCGLIGVFGVPNAAKLVKDLLIQLQHRGQTAAGIVSAHDGKLYAFPGLGLVDEVFGKFRAEDWDRLLPGDVAVGHVRYATQGNAEKLSEVQPMTRWFLDNEVALAHNGNITNYRELRRRHYQNGGTLASQSDTEILFTLAAQSREPDPVRRIAAISRTLEGAWTILALRAAPEPKLVASCDPLGFRPLAFAPYQGGYVFASETAALNLLGLRPRDIRHLPAGHSVEVTPSGVKQFSFAHADQTRHCSFEHVYYSRPDSQPWGLESQLVRKRLGRALAAAHLRDGGRRFDVVAAVPDSSNSIAEAFAREIAKAHPDTEFVHALIRNHYTGRTFITPRQADRVFGVRMKLNAVDSDVEGKVVAIVDDSLVRGTTARKVVSLLREHGAKEVHFFSGSPPVTHPCHWGIDTATFEELAWTHHDNTEAIAREIGADSMRYVSQADLQVACDDEGGTTRCYTCFTGVRPEKDVDVHVEALTRRNLDWTKVWK